MNLSMVERLLICGITPYFLEKGNFWIEENLNKLLEARKTQAFFQDNILFLTKSQKNNLSETLRKLDEMGYERVWQVSEPGEFSQRGGIVDVFPVNSMKAARLEFLGNKIENIEQLPVEIKDEKSAKEILKKKLKSQKLFSDLKGLKPGDYLVHLDHGIAQFSGIEKSEIPNPKSETNYNYQSPKFQTQEYYVLKYAAEDRLYVTVGLERKLSKYIGFVEPKISRLGSSLWQKVKRKIKEETEKLAKELLEIYAKREITTRSPYLPENEINSEISNTFQYEETPDQIQTLNE